ncbi:MAG: serine hydrolase domain-containing protein [Phycisphaerales bacterium]
MRVACTLLLCVTALGALARAQDAPPPPVVRPFELSTEETASLDSLAAEHGLDAGVLKAIVKQSRRSESDAIVLIKDGRTLIEEYSAKEGARGPIEAMSATKSVVALAFGCLLADGRLDSLDAPVHRFYPEWNQGLKARITIRHLLTQRSGLHCERITTEIYRSPDFVQFALAADLVEEPGTKWRYNNSATNLLAGIVEKIAGQRMDMVLGAELFAPMGITDWTWSLDDAGNPHAMAGLQIRAPDLAKIGELMMHAGVWGPDRTRILPEAFVREATSHYEPLDPDRFGGTWEETAERGGQGSQGQRYGLLWWPEFKIEQTVSDRLIGEWRRLGTPEDFIAKMTGAKGLTYPQIMKYIPEHVGGEQAWLEATVMAGRPDLDTTAEDWIGYSARGYLGQYLIVIPEHRLVCTRMRIAPGGDHAKVDSFGGLLHLVRGLGGGAAGPK